jgi:hypothetical protein
MLLEELGMITMIEYILTVRRQHQFIVAVDAFTARNLPIAQ